MHATPDRFDARGVEAASRRFWASRSLPPADGVLGPSGAPRIHQLLGAASPEEAAVAVLQRAVISDIEARYLAKAGRRTTARLLIRGSEPAFEESSLPGQLHEVGVWLGGGKVERVGVETDRERLQGMLDRLATGGLLVRREVPLRFCPRCRTPRTPAGLVYQEEDGVAYLLRFPMRGSSPRTSLLVWVDSLWKLLDTAAVLGHPDLPYVTARFRRRGVEEQIVTSKSSLERLRTWIPGADVEVIEEFPGKRLEGKPYDHPLSTEVPSLTEVAPPRGLFHTTTEVTDTGTGLVALLPGHGSADADVARGLALEDTPPILDPDYTLSRSFLHKYQGLSLETAESFIHRDLSDGGFVFAQLTVRRGVPHCATCGTALVWERDSAWCFEPGHLSAERLDLFGRLLPHELAPPVTESVPWPITEASSAEEAGSFVLQECTTCGRLAPAGETGGCPCGGQRYPVRRRVLALPRETLAAWARETPFPTGEGVRIYVADRRRIPSFLHHLMAMEAADAHPGDVRLSVFPTIPLLEELGEVGPDDPFDSLRAALASFSLTPRGGPVALSDRRALETRRLSRVWALARSLRQSMDRDGFSLGKTPIAAHMSDLLDEDRAFLSGFERMRIEVLRLFETGSIARAQRHLVRYFDEEVRGGYLPLVRRRLELPGLPQVKSAVYLVLAHVLPLWAELYGPIAPFTMEAVYRSFRGESGSLFELPFTPVQDSALDPKAERLYARWRSVARALNRARQHFGLGPQSPLALVVLYIRDESVANELRSMVEVLGRISNVNRIEVASPNLPWEGKRVDAVPVPGEIQRAFGSDSSRVIRLLSGLSGRRAQEGVRSGSLQVAVEGRQVQISRSMVEFVETLPPGIAPVPWELGELYLQLPESVRASEETGAPPLSPDGYRLLRRVRRRLRRAAKPESLLGIVVAAQGQLAEEMQRATPALYRYLLLPDIKVVGTSEGFPPSETIEGRSGRGDPWAVWIPGIPPPPRRRKDRAAREGSARLRHSRHLPVAGERELDALAEPVQRRENSIEEWLRRLDETLGRPFVGPSKLRNAWDAGFQTFDDLVHAPFDRLSAIPGFGPYVAAELVRPFGGQVPSALAHRVPVTEAPEASPAIESPTARRPTDAAKGSRIAPEKSVGPATVLREMGPAPTTRARDPPAPPPSFERPPAPPAPETFPPTPPTSGTPAIPTEAGEAAPAPEAVQTAPPETVEGERIPRAVAEEPRTDVESDAPAPVPASDSGVPQTPSMAANAEMPAPNDSSPEQATPEVPPEGEPSLTEPIPAEEAPEVEAPEGEVTLSVGVPSVDGPEGPQAGAGPVPLPELAVATEAELTQPRPPEASVTESPHAPTPSPPEVAEAPPAPPPEVGTPPPPILEPSTSAVVDRPEVPPPQDSSPPPEPAPPEAPAVPEEAAGVPTNESPHVLPETPSIADAAEASNEPPGAVSPPEAEQIPDTAIPAEATVPPEEEELAPVLPPEHPGEASAPDRAGAETGLESAQTPTTVVASPPPVESAPPESTGEVGSDTVSGLDVAPGPESASPPEVATPVLEVTSPPTEATAPATEEIREEGGEPEIVASSGEEPAPSAETPAPVIEGTPPPTEPIAPSSDGTRPEIAEAEIEGSAAVGPALPPETPGPVLEETPSPTEGPTPTLEETRLEDATPETPPIPTPDQPVPSTTAAPILKEVSPRLETTETPERVPVAPVPETPPSGVSLRPGPPPSEAWVRFLDATGAGHRGLCLSREFPDRLRALLGTRDVTIRWLSAAARAESVRPTDLEGMGRLIESAMTEQGVRAVYIDNVEYLVRVNTLPQVMAFLHHLHELGVQHFARVWVALNPMLVRAQDVETLTQEFPATH